MLVDYVLSHTRYTALLHNKNGIDFVYKNDYSIRIYSIILTIKQALIAHMLV